MKLAFSTHPINQDGTACLEVTKAIKTHEGVSVNLMWHQEDGEWVPGGFTVRLTRAADMKAASNIIVSLDKAMDELKLWAASPLEWMRKMEKGGTDTAPAIHVVIHGGEQLCADDLSKIKDQWRPAGFDAADVLVNAVDEDDAKSTIKGRMIKLLSDADKAAAVGKWFAAGQCIEQVPTSAKPTFVPQSAYK